MDPTTKIILAIHVVFPTVFVLDKNGFTACMPTFLNLM